MPKTTCTIDGCHALSIARGWCRHHYNKQYKGAPLDEVILVVDCKQCGEQFAQRYERIYCGQKCREDAQYQNRRQNPETWAAYLEQRRNEYVKKTEQPGYQRPKKAKPPCSIADCGNISASRAMCVKHYKRWARANGLLQSPSDRWSDTRRSNSHARRARMNGGRTGDRVLMADLLLRDGPTCSACLTHIDVDIPWPDPYSPSVDHTVPLSKGGEHAMSNCTVMHLRCNIVKGARLDTQENKSEAKQPSTSQAA